MSFQVLEFGVNIEIKIVYTINSYLAASLHT